MLAEPKESDIIAVWFSCGAASAVALKRTFERYGNLCQVRAVNNPVAEEDEDNRRFLRDVERWVGVKIEDARNSKYPAASAVEVWERRGAMSFPKGAPCTKPHWHVFGFGAEERDRHEMFTLTERANVLPILIDEGLTRQACFEIVVNAGLEPPRIYAMGYPNANCIGCVKATSPTYWNHVRQAHPAVFAERAEQSRRLGVQLVRVKNERVYLDELDPKAVGRPLKSLKMPECDMFCEERRPRIAA